MLSICSLKAANIINKMSNSRPSSDLASFRKLFKEAKKIVVLTGAGVSAESGIPTFRGEGGLWRKYSSQNLATLQSFRHNPSLVWEFYHYRRELVLSKFPNDAHKAIAECQARLAKEGRDVTVITQNIDGMHQRTGTKGVVELHGSLWKTLCLKCHEVAENFDSPICSALAGKGLPEVGTESADIPERDLPRCKNGDCGGLLRPYVVWFGENLDSSILELADHAMSKCDLCLIIGTSSVVYPAAMFAPQAASRGVPTAEFNIECQHNFQFHYYFEGPCTKTLPPALAP